MTFTSIGDLARQFSSIHHVAATRQRLDILTSELASGLVRDPAARLSGRTDILADTRHHIATLDAGLASVASLSRRLETAQIALEQVDEQRMLVSQQLLSMPAAINPRMLADASAHAEGALASIVSALNTRHGAETLFAGRTTDRPALTNAETILTALRADVAGAVDATDLIARIDSFFDDPGGGFAAVAYLGDDGPPLIRRVAEQDWVILPRADNPALREVMKSLALTIAAAEHPTGISDTERVTLMHDIGAALVGAAESLTAIRAQLGTVQERADAVSSRQSAALTAARIQYRDLIAASPEETAVALREVETQLQTQFAVTARLAGLTLAGYLR